MMPRNGKVESDAVRCDDATTIGLTLEPFRRVRGGMGRLEPKDAMGVNVL